jgi:hypothetical protein
MSTTDGGVESIGTDDLPNTTDSKDQCVTGSSYNDTDVNTGDDTSGDDDNDDVLSVETELTIRDLMASYTKMVITSWLTQRVAAFENAQSSPSAAITRCAVSFSDKVDNIYIATFCCRTVHA